MLRNVGHFLLPFTHLCKNIHKIFTRYNPNKIKENKNSCIYFAKRLPT